MPRFRTRVAHGLSQREAIDRLKAFYEKHQSLCETDGTWEGSCFTFRASTQGIRLSGKIQVEVDALAADIQVPLIAMPFTGWLPGILARGLAEPVESHGESLESGLAGDHSAIEARGDSQPDCSQSVVLFLHIPKAGGTTLSDYVFAQCRSEESGNNGLLNAGVYFVPFGFFKEPDLIVPESARSVLRGPGLRAAVGHFWFGLHNLIEKESNYITILRDPVERVISLYYYLNLEGRMSLEEFAAAPPFKEVENDQTRRISGLDPELGHCTVEMLSLAQSNLRRSFSVVGITERFDETLVLMKGRLGWLQEVPSYPKNTNPNRPRLAALSPRCLDEIRRRNELDIALYDFAWRLLDEAVAAEGSGFRDDLDCFRSLRTMAVGPMAAKTGAPQ